MHHHGNSCGCMCHKSGGIIVALIGIVLLLGNFEILDPKIVHNAWPVLIVIWGLNKAFLKGKCNCCKGENCGDHNHDKPAH